MHLPAVKLGGHSFLHFLLYSSHLPIYKRKTYRHSEFQIIHCPCGKKSSAAWRVVQNISAIKPLTKCYNSDDVFP